jgi:hypothetical protein
VGLASEQCTKVPPAQAVFAKVMAVKTASAVFFTLKLMLFFPFKIDRNLAANLFCFFTHKRLAARILSTSRGLILIY